MISCFVFIFLVIGIYVLSDIKLTDRIKHLIKNKPNKNLPRQIRKIPLKVKVYKLLGKEQIKYIKKLIYKFKKLKNEALQTLDKTGETSNAKKMERNCLWLALIGVVIGLAMKNLYLVPVLASGLYFIPLWAVKLSYNSYVGHVNNELEIALSQITSSYISSNNILTAVKDNLQYLNAPVYDAFERFVITLESVNPNRVQALETLRDSFDSLIFKEWCSALVQCQHDNDLKSTLQPHVNKFSRQKYMQEKQRTGQMIPFKEFAMMCILVPSCVLGLAVFSPSWFNGLVNNDVGKIAITVTVVIMIVGLNRAVDIARPYEYRG